MNTIRKTRQFAGAALFAAAAALLACPCVDASFIEMGLNRDKMPVDIDEVLHTFERARRLQFLEMRELQDTSEVVPTEEAIIEVEDISIQVAEDAAIDGNETAFFAMEEIDMAFEEEKVVVEGRTESAETGPRGGRADLSPNNSPTEISFMIIMEDFGYSAGIDSIDDITIGTKFGFTGRIATKAEDLGIASGSCTVTSDIKKELSYCDIYHKIDTDNFGGFGSVMVAGTADEVGGRLLVTGTGGSLQSTSQGYAMVQFDPAGNPVLYVLLKLF